jgi:hypothetical protein
MDTVQSAYGQLDKNALSELGKTYDPQLLLRGIEEYDQVLSYLGSAEGPRDSLVRLWCIAANLLSGATAVLPPSEADFELLLNSTRTDLEEAVEFFQGCLDLIEPLRRLPAANV